jgi:hypothetical protein
MQRQQTWMAMLQMIPSLSKKRLQVFVQYSSQHCSSLQRLYTALNDESVSKKQRVLMFQTGFGGGNGDQGANGSSGSSSSSGGGGGSGGGGATQGGNGSNGSSERKQTVLSACIFNLMTSKIPEAHIGQIITR